MDGRGLRACRSSRGGGGARPCPLSGYLSYDPPRCSADQSALGREPASRRAGLDRRRHARPLQPRRRDCRDPRWGRRGDRREARGGRPWHREPRGLPGPTVVRRDARYEEMVRNCKEHIVAGDVFQCVPSQRRRADVRVAPDVYRACARVNRRRTLSPRSRRHGARRLVAERLSPAGRRSSLCPIAGTTEPTEGDVERLLSSEKDRAEHGCSSTSAATTCRASARRAPFTSRRNMEVERFSHVSHLVSEVVGELSDGTTPFELLRACFRPGPSAGRRRSARCGSSPARGLSARPVLAEPSSTRSRAAPWTMHRAPDDGDAGGTAHLGGRGGDRRRTRDPRPSTRSACTSSRRSRPRSTSPRRRSRDERTGGCRVRAWRVVGGEGPDSRRLRLVHLQPVHILRALGAEV